MSKVPFLKLYIVLFILFKILFMVFFYFLKKSLVGKGSASDRQISELFIY